MDRYLDLEALSAYSWLSVSTLRRYIRRRGLPHYALDGKLLIKRSEFDEWLGQFRRVKADVNKIVDAVIGGLEQ